LSGGFKSGTRYWDALYESGMKLVEIIRGYSTSDEVTKTTLSKN
jgi:hypothetical protein